MNAPLANPTRRGLIVGAAVVGGALLVGCSRADVMSAGAPKLDLGAFGPFVRIDPQGIVTVVARNIEFGQGTHSGLAAIVAEELDADWSKVRVEDAPANSKIYANPLMGAQGTGGSTAITSAWDQMRKAGAGARAMFVEAAAKAWGVPAAEITVKDGVVAHASGKRASFAQLLPEAAKVTPPAAPKLKDPKTFTLVGTARARRKDSPVKVTGQAVYTQDVRLPGMLTAVVAHPPRFGAKPKEIDDAEALKVPGVVAVHKLPTGVAVLAENTWAARQGRDALNVTWDESKAETRGSDQILAWYKELAGGKGDPGKAEWREMETRGAEAAAPQGDVFEAAYDFPYLAHAAMEPMNCVAEVKGGKAKLTFACQSPTLDQVNAAFVIPALPGSVEIKTLFAGGSFGRRASLNSDYVVECVRIAKKAKGKPVKLVWTREDDMAAGQYRPLAHHAVKVVLDKDGYPAAWTHRLVIQSILDGFPGGAPKVDPTAIEGVKGSPYLKVTPKVDAQYLTPKVGVPVLWWRSVGATHNAYVMEHTIDQLARRAGKDPVEYRRTLYRKAGASRHLAVLDLAAEKADWAGGPPAGWTRGVAVHESFGSVVAQIAEVQLRDGVPKVGRVVTAIDCGTAVVPDQVAAQMEGGTCYGLSAALFGAITLKDGKVEQSNFHDYRVLRFSEAPQVETHILPSSKPPTGVGEPGAPVIGPAVANALLAITGKPSLSQPFVTA